MKKEFVVERQGRSFVLFAGLLDEAHRQGLKRIETQLVQIPSPDNGQVAISRAVVETDRGVFSGIGDASPDNVSRNIMPHIIRMSETRAIARALRMAVNIGATAVEELADLDDGHASGGREPSGAEITPLFGESVEPGQERGRRASSGNGRSSQQPAHQATAGSATPAQVKAIYVIGRSEHQMDEEDVDKRSRELFGEVPSQLTKRQASEFIDRLKRPASGQ